MRAGPKTLKLPPLSLLNQLLDYDKDTGLFTDKRRKDGKCGKVENSGYLRICIKGRRYVAHRIVWKMVYGSDPELFIDHINGDKLDNRLSNLRQATFAENRRNISILKSNTSGVKGVGFDKSSGRWRAEIMKDRVSYYLGTFKTKKDASAAYWNKATELHGEFARAS